MKKMTLLISILTMAPAFSEDQDSLGALHQTQKVLSEKGTYDLKLDQMTGSKENTQELYGIASEVFEKLFDESEGSELEISRAIAGLQENPASLEKLLTPSQRLKIKSIAEGIDQKKLQK